MLRVELTKSNISQSSNNYLIIPYHYQYCDSFCDPVIRNIVMT